MRLTTARGRDALLTYGSTARGAPALADVLGSLAAVAAPVREKLGVTELGIGLSLGRVALTELRRAGIGRLRSELARHGLYVFTLDGVAFGAPGGPEPYGPDWSTSERRVYTLELAEALAALLPDEVSEGTISTLPLAQADRADGRLWDAALAGLCGLAEDLARVWETKGKSIRVCLHLERGCVLQNGAEAVRFFSEALPEGSVRHKVHPDVIAQHLGVCAAVQDASAAENPLACVSALRAGEVPVGMVRVRAESAPSAQVLAEVASWDPVPHIQIDPSPAPPAGDQAVWIEQLAASLRWASTRIRRA